MKILFKSCTKIALKKSVALQFSAFVIIAHESLNCSQCESQDENHTVAVGKRSNMQNGARKLKQMLEN